MTSYRLILACVLAAGIGCSRNTAPVQRGAASQQQAGETLVIRNVTVIPMTADSIIPGATVVIHDGRIADVRSGESGSTPRGARVIDGSGKYLIPGLTDMHTHLFSDGELVHDSAGASELAVMLANGITTARLMIGTPEQLVLREAVASGRVAGPTLWVASPQLTGRASENAMVVTTAEQARTAVKAAKEAGYDFIKLTQFITTPVYDAITAEAKSLGIKVVGHVDPEFGVARALAAGQEIEHLDGYFEATLADDAPMKVSVTQGGLFRGANWLSLDHIDDRKVDSIAGASARAGVFMGPTHNIFNTAFAIGESETLVSSRPDWHIWPPRLREGYLRAHRAYWDSARTPQRTKARMKRYVDVRDRLLKAFQDSGGKILAGSDTPEWFHSYGWGLHRELQSLVGAGLSPRQALAAATSTPAEFLGVSDQLGSITEGKRADLVLLSANPLTDIGNTQRIEGVVIRGRWLDRSQLDTMLGDAVRKIQAATHTTQHVVFLHGRIVEEQGRRPTDPVFGVYEYDAILDSLRAWNFNVISEQRPAGIPVDSSATRLINQIDSLQRAGVSAEAITVVGFSRGGAIAILASSRMNNPALSWVFIGACGDWVFNRPEVKVSGRILSLYEKSDSLGVSCEPLLERRVGGGEAKEIPLSLGLGHGTFYKPRSQWILPIVAWVNRGSSSSERR